MLPQLEFPSQVVGFSQASSQNQEYRISQCQQKSGSGENPAQHQMLPQLEFPSQVLGFSHTSSQNQEHIVRDPTQLQSIVSGDLPVGLKGLLRLVGQDQSPSVLTKGLVSSRTESPIPLQGMCPGVNVGHQFTRICPVLEKISGMLP
jgi:hypothetical protein